MPLATLFSVVAAVGGHILNVANSILVMVGLVVVGGALLVLYGTAYVDELEGKAIQKLKDLLAEIDITVDASVLDVDFLAPIKGIVFGILIIGASIVAVALTGLLGICCKLTPVLCLHLAALILLLVIQLSLVMSIRIGPSTVDAFLKYGVKESFNAGYINHTSTDAISLFWNAAMANFQCCGVDNYEDFKNARNWNSTMIYNGVVIVMDMPPVCCKKITKFDKLSALKSCTQSSSNENNKCTGCYTQAWATLQGIMKLPVTGGIISIIFFVQIGIIVLCILIIYNQQRGAVL